MRNSFVIQTFIFAALIFIASCAGRQEFEKMHVPAERMHMYLADKPDELKPGFKAMLEQGKRNYVLNNMRVGTDALLFGYCDIATTCFDNSLKHIEAVYANTETARKARSLWYEEGMKEFKGEPYERAMAYYYRGLLYMMDGDYENGRACFKSGVMQDAFAEEKQNRCDFALLLLLEGYCSMKLGNSQMSDAAFSEVKRLRPDFVMPKPDSNLLVLVETGKSPRKLADGVGHGELKFFRGRNIKEKRVRLHIKGRTIYPYPIEDIAWQAMTRGGRPVDKIIKGQVQFRETHAGIGTTLTDISSNMLAVSPLSSNYSTMRDASLALGILGVAEMVVAARTRTHADTRYWDNLPDTVHVAFLRLNPGSHRLHIEYLTQDNVKISVDNDTLYIPGNVESKDILLLRRSGKKYMGNCR